MSIAMSNTISNYTYTYKGQMRASLDKDDDAQWNRSEVQAFADSYEKATGTAINVDKIMETYAGANGKIDVANQEKILKDDVLGLSKLKTTSADTGTTTSTAKAGSVNDILSVINTYTNRSKNYLSLQLDKDGDAQWSRKEVEDYATAYNKATGKIIDVDKIMEKYADDNGKISTASQKKIATADALGLGNVKSAYEGLYVNPATSTVDTSASSKNSSLNLTDLMATMSSAKKASFSVAVNKADNMSALLQNFSSASGGSSFDVFSILSAQNAAKLYSLQLGSGASGSSDTSMSNQLLSAIA